MGRVVGPGVGGCGVGIGPVGEGCLELATLVVMEASFCEVLMK